LVHGEKQKVKYPRHLGGRRALVLSIVFTLAAFALFTITGYVACEAILTHSSFRYSRIARGNVHVDVLIAGNSRAVNLMSGRDAKNPPAAFNLAFNGESYASTFAMIKSYFERGNTAKYVVIEASTLIMEGNNCKDKPYWHLYRLLYDAERDGCRDDDRDASYFPLTAFNSELFLRAIYYLTMKPHGDQGWANDYRIPPQLCRSLPLDHLQSMQHGAQIANATVIKARISELGNWLQSHGHNASIVFVLGPFYYNARSAAAVHDIEMRTDDLLGRGNWLDLASALGADCDNYADAIHANRDGRGKILPLILAYLNAKK
jgi:hypothetical protein